MWSMQKGVCRRVLFFCAIAAWIGSSSEEPAAASARAGGAWGLVLGATLCRKYDGRLFCSDDGLRGGGSGDGASSTADDEDMLRYGNEIVADLQKEKCNLARHGTGGNKQLRSFLDSFVDNMVVDEEERKEGKAASKASSKELKDAMKRKPAGEPCDLCSSPQGQGSSLDGVCWEAIRPVEDDILAPSPRVPGIREGLAEASVQHKTLFVATGQHEEPGGKIKVHQGADGGRARYTIVGQIASKVCSQWFFAGGTYGSVSSLTMLHAPMLGEAHEATVTALSGPWEFTSCEVVSIGGVALCSASPLTSLHRCRLGGSDSGNEVKAAACAILASRGRIMAKGCVMEDVGEEVGNAVIVGGGACVQAMFCCVRRVKGQAFAIQGSCHVALEECELYLPHNETVFTSLSKKNAAQVEIRACAFVASHIFSPDSQLPWMLQCDQEAQEPLLNDG